MKKIVLVGFLTLLLRPSLALADPIYGAPVPGTEAPSQEVPTAPVGPPAVENPEGQGSQQDSPGQNQGSGAGPGNAGPYNPLQNEPNAPGSPFGSPGQPGGQPGQPGQAGQNGQGGQSAQPVSEAPTFMNGALPNTQNPFLPTGISPGTFTAPLTSLFELQGVPALAAPLMGQVYRPFGLSLYQPNPFQIVPQGYASLTGTFETDTNINYSPTSAETGSFYSITPAVAYSTFDDYGYLSVLANASYVSYDTGNIPSYLSEMGGISAGTYVGNRVFVGIQDLAMRGEMPQNTGSPIGFLTGVDPYFTNMGGAEAGFALTPKISFVETAMDQYFDMTAYGAGIMNIQSLTQALNYIDKTSMLSASYTYSQGLFSLYPSFISNTVAGTAMHSLTPTTSTGVGGSETYYMMQGDPLLNFYMITGYGLINHTFTHSLTASVQGGYNVVRFENGQSYPGPLLDLNVTYTSGPLSLTFNAGWFEENMMSYGVEMGPEDVKQALAYLHYRITPKTSFMISGGYINASFFNAPAFSNNFFQTLQPTQNYYMDSIVQTDGVFWSPNKWLTTSLEYNLVSYTTNLPSETIVDNQFIAMVSVYFPF
ncbi:MAG: hypothetical protein VST70_04840 [Nitrospirota bacterium]|nr:hypothetical protein [Nitrospirota bacterium]